MQQHTLTFKIVLKRESNTCCSLIVKDHKCKSVSHVPKVLCSHIAKVICSHIAKVLCSHLAKVLCSHIAKVLCSQIAKVLCSHGRLSVM